MASVLRSAGVLAVAIASVTHAPQYAEPQAAKTTAPTVNVAEYQPPILHK